MYGIKRRFFTATRFAIAIALVAANPGTTVRAVTWDGGGGGDMNWTTDGVGGNWSGASKPGPGDDALFTDAAGGAGHGVVTNIADDDFTIGTLSYEFGPTPASFYQTTQVNSGKTLLAVGGLNVAPVNATSNYTIDTTITGSGGTLQVGNTGTNTADIVLGYAPNYTGYSHVTGDLDLSGLATFQANLDLLDMGHGRSWSQRGYSELKLAPDSTINAQRIHLGTGVGTAKLRLGQDTTINANTFHIGRGKNGGNDVTFQTGLSNPTLTLAGLGGGEADLYVSRNLTNTSGTVNDKLDLTGGAFNATLDDLIIGYFPHYYRGACRGTLTMDDGTVTANSMSLALTGAAAPDYEEYARNTRGTLNFNGGTFTVAGDVTDGNGITTINIGGGTFTVDGNVDLGNGIGSVVTEDVINVTGGTLSVAGSVGGGPYTSTINVDGGTFVSRGTADLTNLNLGTTGTAATLDINGLTAGSRQVGTYNQGANGNLLFSLNAHGTGTIQATTAGVNGTVDVDPQLVPGSSTDPADQSRWIAGTGNWDTTQANWDKGLPGGFTVNTSDSFTFLQAGTLTDGGLSLVNPPSEWTLNVNTGTGQASVTRSGAALHSASVRAVIDDPAAVVTRADHLAVAAETGSDAAMLEVSAGSLTIGSSGSNKNLTLATATAVGEFLQTGGTVTVHGNVADGGSGTSTLNVLGGNLAVNGGLTVDYLRVGRNGLTAGATVSGGAVQVGASGNLDIGVRDTGYTAGDPTTYGTLDLSGASSVTLNLDNLNLGKTNGIRTSGVLLLSPSNLINATTITIGDNPSTGSAGLDNRITLGQSNTINANTFYVGRRKSDGVVDFATGLTDPELTLRGATGGTSRVANLRIGYNDTNTGSVNTSNMDLSAGQVDAMVDSMVVGYHHRNAGGTTGAGHGNLILSNDTSNTFDVNSIVLGQKAGAGSPTASGTITMRGGTFTVNGSVTNGGGQSTLNIDGGTMTVGGDLLVDSLRVGYHTDSSDPNGRAASVITSGNDDVEIGSPTNRTNLYVGWTDQNLTQNVTGQLDLSGSATFTAYLDNFIIGQRTSSLQNYNGDAIGTVTLPDTNYIDARTIVLSDQNMWIGTHQSTLTLGTDNTIKTDLFTAGGRRANALLEFASGGTLDLSGSTGAEADLRVGYQDLGTGSTANSTADFSDGTLNATLDELVIGYALGKGSGGGRANGTMLFGAGMVTANSVTIGDANASVGTGTGNGVLTMSGGALTVDGDISLGTGTTLSSGTINLSDGTLKADSILQGVGSAAFNWTGGTLSVDTFGFLLTQNDSANDSFLSPGDSAGTTTIQGSYNLLGGSVVIELDGPGNYDQLIVDGDVSLAGELDLTLNFNPSAANHHFTIVDNQGTNDVSGIFNGYAEGAEFFLDFDGHSYPFQITYLGGDGNDVVLGNVPEPATLVLVILGGLCLLACRWRKKLGRGKA